MNILMPILASVFAATLISPVRAQNAEDVAEILKLNGQIANAFSAGDYHAALTRYDQVIAIQERMGNKELLKRTLQNYALLLAKLNRQAQVRSVMARIAALEGKSPVRSYVPSVAPPSATEREPAAADAPIQQYSIRQVVRMSDSDKYKMEHPITESRQVVDHYYTVPTSATRVTAWGAPKGGDEVPVYRTDSIKVPQQLQYIDDLKAVIQRHPTADFIALKGVLEYGGTLLELDNGWLVKSLEKLDSFNWSTGARVQLKPHPKLGQPYVALVNERGEVVGAEILATR